MKKLVPNPDFQKAKFAVEYAWHDGKPPPFHIPEVRTNNPHYLADGSKVSDQVPSHIEVDYPMD